MTRLLLAVAALLLLGAPAQAQAPSTDAESLQGYWAGALEFPLALRGELAVTRAGGTWRATIGGENAIGTVDDRTLHFSFGAHGGYRGALARNGDIEGFWLRPSGETRDRVDPGGSGQRFTTPLTLRRGRDGAWRGEVAPLDDRFTLYLRVFHNDAGILVGAFRNPEVNAIPASRFRVARTGEVVRFSIRYDETSPEIVREGTLVASDRLRMQWPEVGAIELVRRTPSEIPAAFPRPPGSPAYAYARPPETGDGWRTALGRDVGVDEAALAGAVQQIVDGDPFTRQPSLVHSFLIARHGKLILEEYFFGYDRDTPHDTRSAGKTFASVMLGAAMRGGASIGPETRITELMAARGPFANPDPRKERVTLAHLMTHASGLACNDNDEASPGNEDTMQSQDAQPDWWKYTLDLPMAFEPGVRYAYCSANMNLMGGALTTATGTWLPEYFDRSIARPLQFGRYHYNLAANGEGYLGGGVFMLPRDLLKVGQMYLDGGVWRGRRIVERDWVRVSTALHMEINEATTGYSAEEFGNYYGRGSDGHAWHRGSLRVGDRDVETYAATGNGGQVLLVVPNYDLVAVFTGGNYRQGGIWGRWGERFVGGVILPAIRN